MLSALEGPLLRVLLDRELASFREMLESENPGLSPREIERYMRAASLFAAHLSGGGARTRGRQLKIRRDSSSGRPAKG
ncbi:MAG: hypothetical protein ACI8TX_001419 [Hyphomicrobiaceae bacterium]|jgi:hypothetical protein